MCLAIPGLVITIDPGHQKALVDFEGAQKTVLIALVPSVQEGQYVIVHAGCAIEVVDEAAALESLELWRQLSADP